jgi:hypothetical protein
VAEPAREFFYLKDRRKQDAALHEPILAEGDSKTANAISRKVAKRLGLSDAQIDALMKPRPELVRTKEWDEAKHPRDPGGKFAESGGSGGGAASEAPMAPDSKSLLVGTGQSRERIENWKQQLVAKLDELDKQGGFGAKESIDTQRMIGALDEFLKASQADINSGKKVFYEVHDLDGNIQAAVFSQFNPETRVATIEFTGGLNHDAKVKALQHSVLMHQETNRAERVEATEFADDETGNLAAYEQAGFNKDGDASGGIQKFIIGAKITEEEKRKTERASAEHFAAILGASKASAKLLGYDPNLVEVSDKPHAFTIGSETQQRYAAGVAHLDTGVITIFPQQVSSAETAVSVMAHEIAHQKYETVLKALKFERDLVLADTSVEMNPDGTLKPPYDAQYPIYSRFQPHLDRLDIRINSDGVTDYSRDWWKAATEGGMGSPGQIKSAHHETIAEMARLLTDTGKLPGHPAWRSYYRDIDKTYNELKGKK